MRCSRGSRKEGWTVWSPVPRGLRRPREQRPGARERAWPAASGCENEGSVGEQHRVRRGRGRRRRASGEPRSARVATTAMIATVRSRMASTAERRKRGIQKLEHDVSLTAGSGDPLLRDVGGEPAERLDGLAAAGAAPRSAGAGRCWRPCCRRCRDLADRATLSPTLTVCDPKIMWPYTVCTFWPSIACSNDDVLAEAAVDRRLDDDAHRRRRGSGRRPGVEVDALVVRRAAPSSRARCASRIRC